MHNDYKQTNSCSPSPDEAHLNSTWFHVTAIVIWTDVFSDFTDVLSTLKSEWNLWCRWHIMMHWDMVRHDIPYAKHMRNSKSETTRQAYTRVRPCMTSYEGISGDTVASMRVSMVDWYNIKIICRDPKLIISRLYNAGNTWPWTCDKLPYDFKWCLWDSCPSLNWVRSFKLHRYSCSGEDAKGID